MCTGVGVLCKVVGIREKLGENTSAGSRRH